MPIKNCRIDSMQKGCYKGIFHQSMTGDGRFSVIQTEILSPLFFFFCYRKNKERNGVFPFHYHVMGSSDSYTFHIRKKEKRKKKKKKRTFKNNFFVTIPSISGKDLG